AHGDAAKVGGRCESAPGSDQDALGSGVLPAAFSTVFVAAAPMAATPAPRGACRCAALYTEADREYGRITERETSRKNSALLESHTHPVTVADWSLNCVTGWRIRFHIIIDCFFRILK